MVNPVPRAYARGFVELLLQGVRNIHPHVYAWGVLWFGVKIDSFDSTELVGDRFLILVAFFFGSGLCCHEELYLAISKLTMTVLRND